MCGASRSPGACGKHPVNALRAYIGLRARRGYPAPQDRLTTTRAGNITLLVVSLRIW